MNMLLTFKKKREEEKNENDKHASNAETEVKHLAVVTYEDDNFLFNVNFHHCHSPPNCQLDVTMWFSFTYVFMTLISHLYGENLSEFCCENHHNNVRYENKTHTYTYIL